MDKDKKNQVLLLDDHASHTAGIAIALATAAMGSVKSNYAFTRHQTELPGFEYKGIDDYHLDKPERRFKHHGESQCSGHDYISKQKHKAKIAKASRQFNRRKAKGMRV